jgi:hypothetical protein
MAVGREHFLRYGLGGAVAEKIAEDAGYSRGAPYSKLRRQGGFVPRSNSRGAGPPEGGLLLHFQRKAFSQTTVKKMREAIADLYTDPEWIVLRAEFEAGSLRNERIRRTFPEVHREQVRDGGNLTGNVARSSEIHMGLKTE